MTSNSKPLHLTQRLLSLHLSTATISSKNAVGSAAHDFLRNAIGKIGPGGIMHSCGPIVDSGMKVED